MQLTPALAFAASPPPRLSRVLSTVRQPDSSAAALQAALDSVDTELAAAEAAVDLLEADRQRLLIAGAEHTLDEIERRITVANRHVEALAAAKRAIPERLRARREIEGSIDRRAAKARELQVQGLAILAEAHGHAAHLAKLLNSLWDAVNEIEAVNAEYMRLGIDARIALPLERLAEQIGCPVTDLPEIGAWSLAGYFENPVAPDRQLSRANEFINSRGRK
ncbi:hypothetical protein [Reyranella sp.]|jgi:chromosome segregation ATPase|uniref:hypothetical protein n=1 Tax=Reyranella sp. TaxID=1929291 RepID=UPI000BDD0B6C|nr:hypothetical protein [Reyranella sp.]OYY38709.1 MAG: hypothetical protein B7Y57_20565 [Rhodospirillales bacterium 35-66-84]OYZ92263.1 MAG: hypothetical protein B7Y08_22910 [Rhodospirillales bacterium 24-66-33]OZB23667.1 MAG: hypothetical protein B7X63_19170 [Rhodospirillales bacterium 39-66-50]HQS15453.1 hypothetical protein [Reyranella sp.]HQT11979.1 hypothetical protein [Reyranella sp.]